MPNPYEEELEGILANADSLATDDEGEIEFKSEAQRLCYRRVREYGRELFGEMFERSKNPKQPTFFLRFGSASVGVTITHWGDGHSMVDIWAWVITKIEMTADLMEFLLRKNYDEAQFGAFRLDETNDIHFSHAILGSELDKKELRTSVQAVASTADEYDELIQSQWGGERWADPGSG